MLTTCAMETTGMASTRNADTNQTTGRKRRIFCSRADVIVIWRHYEVSQVRSLSKIAHSKWGKLLAVNAVKRFCEMALAVWGFRLAEHRYGGTQFVGRSLEQ